jgi:hypothetical protein
MSAFLLEYWLLLTGLAAAVVVLLGIVRWRRRSRRAPVELPEEERENLEQVPFEAVAHPSGHDEHAMSLVRAYREKVWYRTSLNTELSPRFLFDLSTDLVREIARAYHPFETFPMRRTTVNDLSELILRVVRRVRSSLDEFPLNMLADRELQSFFLVHDQVRRFSQHPAYRFVRENKWLYKAAVNLNRARNVVNPWYWARQAAYHGAREMGVRWLYVSVITKVGEEAIAVYSGRCQHDAGAARETTILLMMLNLALADGHVSREEYAALLEAVNASATLDDAARLRLFGQIARGRRVKVDWKAALSAREDRQELMRRLDEMARADRLGIASKMAFLAEVEEQSEVVSAWRREMAVAGETGTVPVATLRAREAEHERVSLELAVSAGTIENKVIRGDFLEALAAGVESFTQPVSRDELEALVRQPPDLETALQRAAALDSRYHREAAIMLVNRVLTAIRPLSPAEENFLERRLGELFGLPKPARSIFERTLREALPAGKLVQQPPLPVLRLLLRTLEHREPMLALVETGTKGQLRAGGRQGSGYWWLALTGRRLLALLAVEIGGTVYVEHRDFGAEAACRMTKGRLLDEVTFRGADGTTLEVRNALTSRNALRELLALYEERFATPSGQPDRKDAD